MMTNDDNQIPNAPPDDNQIPDGIPDDMREFESLYRLGNRLADSPVPSGPDLDTRKMKACAGSASPSAKDEYLAHEAARWHAVAGADYHESRFWRDNLRQCEKRLRTAYDRLEAKIARLDPRRVADGDASPLGGFEIVSVSLIGIVSFGVASIAFWSMPKLWLEYFTSSPAVAIGMCSLGIGGSVILEGAENLCNTAASRTRYLAAVTVLAIIALVIWMLTASSSLGTLIYHPDADVPPVWVGKLQLGSAMACECLVVAAGWLNIQRIFRSHRPTEDNPEHTDAVREAAPTGRRLNRLQGLLGKFIGRCEQHEAALAAHLGSAAGEYDRLRARLDFFN